MCLYFHVFGAAIPSYGCMIFLGLFLANVIAVWRFKKEKLNTDNMVLAEAYGFFGGVLGAKLLYLLVSYKDIEWNRITEPDYLNYLLGGGFVFYGGMIGGLLFVILSGKIHKFDVWEIVCKLAFLIPFAHAFGRIGCFLAGCCYGRPYSGPGAVVFPDDGFAPSGVSLFPIQLLEAGLLFVLFVILFAFTLKGYEKICPEIYIFAYGLIRFCLEFVRYDAERGSFGPLSTSQWISVVMVSGVVFEVLFRRKRVKRKTNADDVG